MSSDAIFSREQAAGYRPEVLAQLKALVIGCGALGQNVLINLALTQVGTVMLTDGDEFELHNAPRSPLFGNDNERRRWGSGKAGVCAHKIRQMVGGWSEKPRILYASVPIQALGDRPFRDASLIISAVDRDGHRGRRYIGEMARKHHRVLIEGGFGGPRINFCVLPNDGPDAPCWSCGQAEVADDDMQFGCTARANALENLGFIPAIQPAAACLGALTAEAAIQSAHDELTLANKRVYLDIRTGRVAIANLAKDPNCSACRDWPSSTAQVRVPGNALCRDLLRHLKFHTENPSVTLPARFVVRGPCAKCGRPTTILRPEWALTAEIRCRDCGGEWRIVPRTGTPGSPLEVHLTLSKDTHGLLDLPLEQVGIVAGSLLEVSDGGQSFTVDVSSTSKSDPFTEVF